jgi:hypothetical protein
VRYPADFFGDAQIKLSGAPTLLTDIVTSLVMRGDRSRSACLPQTASRESDVEASLPLWGFDWVGARSIRCSAFDRTDGAGRRTLASMGLPVIGSTRPWLRWRATAVVAAALGYAWVGGGLRPFSWPAMVATTLGCLPILISAWRRGRSPASVRASREGLVARTLWLVAATGREVHGSEWGAMAVQRGRPGCPADSTPPF